MKELVKQYLDQGISRRTLSRKLKLYESESAGATV